MIKERPLVPSEIAEQLEMQDLLKMVKDKGANLPSQWEQFDENSQRKSIGSLLRGDLTNLGLETLTPDWLEQIYKIGENAKEMLDFTQDVKPKNDKEVS